MDPGLPLPLQGLEHFRARLVVDGELLIEQEEKVKNQPDNLYLVLGIKQIGELTLGRSTKTSSIIKVVKCVAQSKPQQPIGTRQPCGSVDQSWASKLI